METVNLKMIPFEKESLQPVIEKLGAYKRGAEVKSIKCLGGGAYGLVFELEYNDGGVEILKAFKIASMLGSEAEALRLLREVSPLKVPKVFYTHQADEQFPIDMLAMEKIEGVNALSCFLKMYSKKQKKHFAKTVTDALFKIQQTEGEKASKESPS